MFLVHKRFTFETSVKMPFNLVYAICTKSIHFIGFCFICDSKYIVDFPFDVISV